MKKSKFSDCQIMDALKRVEAVLRPRKTHKPKAQKGEAQNVGLTLL